MALSLVSRLRGQQGLRHFIHLCLNGSRDELLAVRGVTYDLGPTFEKRYWERRPAEGPPGEAERAGGLGIDVTTYGDFAATARVALGNGQEAVLTLDSVLRNGEAPTADAPRPVEPPPVVPASSQGASVAALVLGVSAWVLGWLLVALWPRGAVEVSLMPGFVGSASVRVPSALHEVLLAAVAGGLGALVQAALAFRAYVSTRNVQHSWIGWYLLRVPTGLAIGAAVYVAARALVLSWDAPSGALSAGGVAALALAAGYFSGRITTRLQDLSRELLARDPGESAIKPAPAAVQPIAEDVALAESVLRGKEIPVQQMYDLADRLRKANKFGHARRLYGRVWDRGDWKALNRTAVLVGQRHALATYKDPDLPADRRFDRALEILTEVDRLDFAAPALSSPARPPSEELAIGQRQESLGLRGAVHKRRWQIGGQRGDLELALGFYLKGYEIGRAFPGNAHGVETDQGYNGINAAFVLDLLAREEAEEAGDAGREPVEARERAAKARAIREHLAAALTRVKGLEQPWFFHATLAEALLGLGLFDEAVAALRNYNESHGLPGDRLPLEAPGWALSDADRKKLVPRWEFESTITQLATLGRLQADLADMDPALGPPGDGAAWAGPGRKALRDYLGTYAPAIDRAEVGKVGLALSGGGFRASLYHIGVLACLAERDLLRRVEVLSCVSGGSIVGAHYYLELQRLLETTPDRRIAVEDYLDIVERLQHDFLAGVQSNIRSQVYGSILANLQAFFQPRHTTTRRLGALYERELYARVKDERGDRPRYLPNLIVVPVDEDAAAFTPKYDNWRRRSKVPELVLNATTLNTGHNWQFTATWMGEPPLALGREIESNYELRRMYHREAPRLKNVWRWRILRPFAPPDYRDMRLGEAVAASSCVPGLFEPIVLPDLYDGKTVLLVDGGVYDNQGVASLIEQDCNVMIVSDASGQMDAQDHPKADRLGVSLRSFSVSMTRVRDAQYRELDSRTRSGLLKGLVFLHLKRDLDSDPVDWRDCQDPHEASDDARPASQRGVLTQYGIQKPVQRLLAAIRTDLDSFTELEAYALMVSGYRQAQLQLAELPAEAAAKPVTRQWRFLDVEKHLAPGPTYEEALRQLRIGGQTALKVWRQSRLLTAGGLAVLAAATLRLAWVLWVNLDREVPLTLPVYTVRALVLAALVVLAGRVAPHVVALIRYRETLRGLGMKSLAAAVLALVFKLHLLVFDPLFLKLGRLERLDRKFPRS